MDSPALEVSAEINHKAHTGNEYTQRKQRTEALEVLPPATVDIGGDPASWYVLGISDASVFELVLVSSALVHYASDMPNKINLIEYCQGFFN